MNSSHPQSLNTIVDAEQLQKITGYRRAGPMVMHLRGQGIHCFDGPNGPWTTMEIITAAGLNHLGLPYQLHQGAQAGKTQWI
jgi:hypothetical protein